MAYLSCFSMLIVLLTSVNVINSDNYMKRRELVEKYLSTLIVSAKEWIDPNDMLIDEIGLNVKKSEPALISRNVIDRIERIEEIDFKTTLKDSFIIIYLKRWLHKFLSKIEDNSWYEKEKNLIELSVHGELKDIVQKAVDGEHIDFHELDNIIMDSITAAAVNHPHTDFSSGAFNILHFINGSKLIWFIIGLTFLVWLFVMYNPKITVILLIFGSSVFYSWMKLYERAIAEKHHYLSLTDPSECRKSDIGFFYSLLLYIKSFWTKSADCRKYYEALLVDPFWEVSLSVAITDAISITFFQPFRVLAQTLNYCVKEVFSGLSFFQIIIVSIFILCVLLILFNYRIVFLHSLLVIEPGNRSAELACNERIHNAPVPSKCSTTCSLIPRILSTAKKVFNTIRCLRLSYYGIEGGYHNVERNQEKDAAIHSNNKQYKCTNAETSCDNKHYRCSNLTVSNQCILSKVKMKQQAKLKFLKRTLSLPSLLCE